MEPPQPLLRELIGAVLRRERHAQGRTLQQVAARSGVSMQHLSDVERGTKDPSSEVIAAIAGALGITVLELASLVGRNSAVDRGRVIGLGRQDPVGPTLALGRQDPGAPSLGLVSSRVA